MPELGHVVFYVQNLERSSQFYSAVGRFERWWEKYSMAARRRSAAAAHIMNCC